MGLVYHSHDQFVAAIRRKDELAVNLFVQGRGIDLAAKDATGKLPVEIAREGGANDIVRLLQPEAQPAIPLAPVPKVAPAMILPGQLTPEQQEQLRRVILMQQQAEGGR